MFINKILFHKNNFLSKKCKKNKTKKVKTQRRVKIRKCVNSRGEEKLNCFVPLCFRKSRLADYKENINNFHSKE